MATFSNTVKSFQPHAEVDFVFSDGLDFLFSDGSDYVFQEEQLETPWQLATKHVATWLNSSKHAATFTNTVKS